MRDKPKKIFCIDIDGVACEHAKAICERINKEYNLNAEVSEINCWDYNFGPISFIQAVNQYYQDDNFISQMEVTPGFTNFLQNITKKFEVIFVTTRGSACETATKKWIKKQFGYEYKVVFINKKEAIEFEFEFIIDDSPQEIKSLAEKGKICFLFSRPWNTKEQKKLKQNKNIYIVEIFEKILKILKNMEKYKE